MNDWYFLSCKQWLAIFVHHVTWRVFLYLVVMVTNKRDTSRTGGLTEKIFLPVYFVSAVKKNASVGKHFCIAGVSAAVLNFLDGLVCIESDWGMCIGSNLRRHIRVVGSTEQRSPVVSYSYRPDSTLPAGCEWCPQRHGASKTIVEVTGGTQVLQRAQNNIILLTNTHTHTHTRTLAARLLHFGRAAL